jgi:CIC family chloride channel protein
MTDEELLSATPVRLVMNEVESVGTDMQAAALVDQLLSSPDGVRPVVDGAGKIYGIVQLAHVQTIWRDRDLHPLVVTADLAQAVLPIASDQDASLALERMESEDVDALPVTDPRDGSPYGVVTRAALRRLLQSKRANDHRRGAHQVAPTEVVAEHPARE